VSSRRRDPDADPPEWARELGDVRPLDGRDTQAPPPAGRARAGPGGETAPVPFAVERSGETLLGRAPGVDRQRLRKLRRGQVAVDETLDLHGMLAPEAERALRETLLRAHASGARCVLVVHGRGLHSAEGAVLKDRLPDWLTSAPLGAIVLAFASAAPRHGGPGASYVLIRKVG
jgi:DNA-nicking Smr family endonuclease